MQDAGADDGRAFDSEDNQADFCLHRLEPIERDEGKEQGFRLFAPHFGFDLFAHGQLAFVVVVLVLAFALGGNGDAADGSGRLGNAHTFAAVVSNGEVFAPVFDPFGDGLLFVFPFVYFLQSEVGRGWLEVEDGFVLAVARFGVRAVVNDEDGAVFVLVYVQRAVVLFVGVGVGDEIGDAGGRSYFPLVG